MPRCDHHARIPQPRPPATHHRPAERLLEFISQPSLPTEAQLEAAQAKVGTIRTGRPSDYDFLVISARKWVQELCFRDWAMKGFPRSES